VFVSIAIGFRGWREAGDYECPDCKQRKGHPPKRKPYRLLTVSATWYFVD